MAILLRALTWNDLRGVGPAAPLSKSFLETDAGRGVTIEWHIQPLSGFESAPVIEHAKHYDLMVIDHPHVIEAARSGSLAPLSLTAEDAYVGPSLASYSWEGRLWAAPVDAASHVAALRGDAAVEPPTTWAALLDEARHGLRIAVPLQGVHALMALLTILASMGTPFDSDAAELEQGAGFPPDDGLGGALEHLQSLSAACVRETLRWNPLDALTALVEGRCDYLPLTFGYAHFVTRGVRFVGIPGFDSQKPPRPVLGGTGIAVSARRPQVETAAAFARFAASEKIQTGLWPEHGGQPAHLRAWQRLAETQPFYRDTFSSVANAYVRPRCIGWNRFQSSAGETINNWLQAGEETSAALARRLRTHWQQATASTRAITPAAT